MAYATLTFSAPINASCQVGDMAYYTSTSSGTPADGGFTNQSGAIVEIGKRDKHPFEFYANNESRDNAGLCAAQWP